MAEITALVILAEGGEEMETVIVVDILRRAKINVTLASLSDDASDPILCSRNIKIVADCSLKA
jgi:protein DJ-1